ncbi:MAG: hypothetical protein COW00_17865 [Bdellovibrio sp. CG12_big_fil_rev_8_21_14_0_65_39_13]|nr:MAG: hypothetical protein COW78_06305 [Bdellovibrio sp. CG22_combo_CG10-13_8_21_14_all_39_27]PIQ57975.1 MAG: hypothetical protein COW00_17865 [Bdellovibrio sp. CG12_big_fil_rev_8_21_14_0_65_39_13]PIR32890.1 MAG: hypothetical protein COV37_17475 [Bdellovibrio sp. CG11_big_fil_rev_8_21_14_0_20_39_38]
MNDKKSISSLKIPQKSPLSEFDTINSTFGCRHTNPDICSSNQLEKVCAFVCKDSICRRPPRSWPTIFSQLKEGKDGA